MRDIWASELILFGREFVRACKLIREQLTSRN